MILIGTRALAKTRDRTRRMLTMRETNRRFDPKKEQEAYFKRGVDGGKSLALRTVAARLARRGYYKSRRAPGVTAAGPYGKWTGNTLQHTHRRKAKVTVSDRKVVFRHNLIRRINEYWDLKAIDRRYERDAERDLQKALGRVAA